MNQWEHENNIEKAKRLKEKGYEFEYDAYQYKVAFKGEFVHAAGVISRPKMHWSHKQANIKDNLFYCVLAAEEHERREPNPEHIKAQHPDMRCGSCGDRLVWQSPYGGYTHAGAMFDRHGAWAVEEWEED